jgi:hypothetical protein
MNSRRLCSILSLLLIALSVFGKSDNSNVRRAVSSDEEEIDNIDRVLVSNNQERTRRSITG